MSNLQYRRRKNKIHPLLMLGLGIALILAGSWSYQLYKKDQSLEAKRATLIAQKNAIIAKNDNLRQEIEKLNTPSYIEQLAREKLGLVRKGEILIAPKEQ
ncbi:MAG: FtsB family cell division protein [Desulfitobacteriia bacterium]|jgi:cell division protein DivIC